jgi:hypothetical protein
MPNTRRPIATLPIPGRAQRRRKGPSTGRRKGPGPCRTFHLLAGDLCPTPVSGRGLVRLRPGFTETLFYYLRAVPPDVPKVLRGSHPAERNLPLERRIWFPLESGSVQAM